MFQNFVKLKIIFLMLFLWTKYNSSLSKSVFLCYMKSLEISCTPDDQYIVIKDAIFGYLPSFRNVSFGKTNGCRISDSFIKGNQQDCKISLMKNISRKCSGIKACKVEYLYSQYLQKDSLSCPEISKNYQILTLYIDYECVPKDLFYVIGNFDNIQFTGGYITSVGYLSQKSNAHDDYKETLNHFRKAYKLPIKKTFRPKTLLEKTLKNVSPVVFQFQILENTLCSYQKPSTFNTTDTCQMGELYLQDYYSFIPSNKSSVNQSLDKSITICPSSRAMVGESFEPIISERIDLKININFTFSVNMNKALLMKFTVIFCSPLFIKNARVVYDHKLNSNTTPEVIGFAKVECYPGYFLLSPLADTVLYLNCNHETGVWDRNFSSIKCINDHEIYMVPDQNQTERTNSKRFSVTTVSTFFSLFDNQSSFTTSLPFTTNFAVSSSTKYILWSLSILVLALCVCGFVLYNYKLKCFLGDCTLLSKIFNKNECLHNHINSTNHFNNSILYRPVNNSGTSISGSLSFIDHPLLSNGSCMQSNRTLVTRVGSKPTITSRDSFPLSSNLSDFEINQTNNGDELPKKVPKQSPIRRILLSPNTSRNHSLTAFRPMSLSRQSFNDRSSNVSAGRYSGSQVPLLKHRRNCINSEIIETPSIMWTSDISPSKSNPRYNERINNDSELNLLSQSDVSLKINSKLYSPTIDTYLEPALESTDKLDEEESFSISQTQKKTNEDYMIYDHSRISSNNIDSTCPSSVIEAFPTRNHVQNDENKRFSMISNNYYGLQLGQQQQHLLFNNNSSNSENQNNLNHSNESVYESIDDDPLYQSTLERRKMALPIPPRED